VGGWARLHWRWTAGPMGCWQCLPRAPHASRTCAQQHGNRAWHVCGVRGDEWAGVRGVWALHATRNYKVTASTSCLPSAAERGAGALLAKCGEGVGPLGHPLHDHLASRHRGLHPCGCPVRPRGIEWPPMLRRVGPAHWTRGGRGSPRNSPRRASQGLAAHGDAAAEVGHDAHECRCTRPLARHCLVSAGEGGLACGPRPQCAARLWRLGSPRFCGRRFFGTGNLVGELPLHGDGGFRCSGARLHEAACTAVCWLGSTGEA
jgi:hypothetical protein